MEDYIYYLLLAGWLAFSFYQQSQKKKRRAAEIEAARARQEQQGNIEQEKQPDSGFKKILEELLQVEQVEEEIQSYEQRPVEVAANFDDEAIAEKNKFQKYLESKLYREADSLETNSLEIGRQGNPIFESEKDIFGMEEEMEVFENQKENVFNLRSAVIYSEILKRRI